MLPGKGAGYTPLDLESNVISGQWRTIEEHERLQQEGAILSTTATDSPESSGPEFADYYGQQRQQISNSREKIAWIVGGCFVALLVVATTAAVLNPRGSVISFSKQQSSTAPASSSNSNAADTRSPGSSSVNERGSRTSSSSIAADQDSHASSSNSSHGVWHEGGQATTAEAFGGGDQEAEGFVPCRGQELQCGIVNKQPIPEADFRNLPRRSTASGGMVASDNSRCSDIGREVLSTGGNAVDAAVATALCLGVVNPVSSGLGGGAFITIRLANGTGAFYDARETAPAAATEDMYTGLPANASLFGGLAVAVPGELQGLEAAWRRYGSKPWSTLVKRAAELARSGFAAHPYLVYIMSGAANLKRLKANKALREAFLIQSPGGGWRVPRVGEVCCRRPKLADTLDKIAAQGAAYLTSPSVTAAHASELAAAGGIITAQDLAGAAPQERELLRVQLGDLELLVPPPPSSAAVVAFVLKFLAGYGNTLLSNTTTGSSSSSSSSSKTAAAVADESAAGSSVLASFGPQPERDMALGMHRLVEAFKHGFAVRTALGDPGTPDRPFKASKAITAAVQDLLNDSFVTHLRGITSDDTVLRGTMYGGRWNPEGVAPPEEHGTSHLCVVDADRNAVSLTTSVNTPFGSGVVSDTTGILFGNTMDDFASPSKKTLVTPHPSEANFIAPGRRPLSAMSPIIVTHKASGRLVAVAGASGGPLIVSATAQTLARLLLEGVDVAQAVSAPRLHDQLVPVNASFVEQYTWGHTSHEIPQYVVQQLEARDQVVKPTVYSLGVSQAIFVDYGAAGGAAGGGATRGGVGVAGSDKGLLVGASDSRKDGAPAGHAA